MNKAVLKKRMNDSFLPSIGYATFRACWTAPLIVSISGLFSNEGIEFVVLALIIGIMVSIFVASLHSVVVIGFLSMFYRRYTYTDTAGMLFGRLWLLHSFSVWMIPAILMVVLQATEVGAWQFLVAVMVNSTYVLWLFCQRYVTKRDISISELKKLDREAAIKGLTTS